MEPTPALKLGILEQGRTWGVKPVEQALREAVLLARSAEELGYSRYWLSEHHDADMSWASPELMVAVIAQSTRTIRVGTAGVLLPLYSALKVAHNFRLLEGLFPGRIDMGLCKSLAGRANEAIFGRGNVPSMQDVGSLFERKIEEIVAFLSDTDPSLAPTERVRAVPALARNPAVWMLGMGTGSLTLADQYRLSYCHSLFFHQGEGAAGALRKFVDARVAAAKDLGRSFSVCVAGVCAESEARASELEERWASHWAITVAGTPAQCREKFLSLQRALGVDEIIFMNVCDDYAEKLRGYEMLADVMKLSPRRGD